LGWILGPTREGSRPAILGVVNGLALGDGLVLVAEGPERLVHAFDLEGKHVWSLLHDLSPRPVNRNAFLASIRPTDLDADARREFDAEWRDRDLPDHLPSFRGFLTDQLGRVWIEDYPLPSDSSVTWSAYRQNGSWVSSLSVPANFHVTDIEDGMIAGVIVDDVGVQRAAIFDVRRNGDA